MTWRSVWATRTMKLVVSGILIAAVIWQVGPNAVIPETIRWRHLVAAVALFFASNLIGAYQWNLLLRSAGIELPFRAVTRTYFVALFFNNFLIGNVGGDVLRALDVRRTAPKGSSGQTATGVATIVMDRFLGFFTMMWFAGAAAWLSGDHGGAAVPIAALLISFVALGVLLTSRRIGTRFDALIMKFVPDRMAQTIVNLRTGFVAMRYRYGVLLAATLISVLVQGLRIVVHYECARAVGLNVPLVYFFTFIPLVGVAAAIPISSGGLGTREWAAVGLFRTVGVGGAAIVMTELFAHATTLVSALPGAFAFVLHKNAPRTASAAEKEPEVEEA